MTGRFIAFEGIDIEILSDQAERLANWLRVENGIKSLVITREPTDGPIGAQLRSILNGRILLHEYPFSVLQNADRMDHLFRDDGILRDLENGNLVLSTRYILSAFAYETETVHSNWLMSINQLCRWPDLTLFIDTSVSTTLTRLVYEQGFKSEEVDRQKLFLEKARLNYLKAIDVFRKQGKRIEIIESESATAIHAKCIDLFQNEFNKENIE